MHNQYPEYHDNHENNKPSNPMGGGYSSDQHNYQYNMMNMAGNAGGKFQNPRNYYDIENQRKNDYGSQLDQSGEYNESTLLSSSARKGFIRKVYSILTFQIFVTVLVTFAGIQSTSFNSFLKDPEHIALFYVCFGVTLVISIVLACCSSVARQVPTNYILLSSFTCCEAYIVAQICVLTKPQLVLIAALLTLVMVIALTFYAMTTKTDITMSGGLLFTASAVLLVGGIFLMFTNNNTAHIIYSCLGVIVFSIYIIYDTQLLLDSSQHQFSIDDYIVAALQLYIDIINMFLNILSILSRSSD